jgi:hypothetical protein
MVRRAVLVVGLIMGLLGMHGLAQGSPVAHAQQVSMLAAATASGAAAEAGGHDTSAPCHRDPAPHHDLCKAVRTGVPTSIAPATTAGFRVAVEPIDSAPPTPAGAASCGPRPPDISRLGVLRI